MPRQLLRPLLLLLVLHSACDRGSPATPDAAISPVTQAPSADRYARLPDARPMMVELTRDYCLACQVMAPAVAELRGELAASVDVVEVNIDREKNERFALLFVVDSVPAQVFVDASGRVVARRGGVASKDDLRKTMKGLGWIP